jgi:antitoxin ParD1/3/4
MDHYSVMPTMNISLTTQLRDYVEAQIRSGDYQTTSEYVRDLIRRDQDRSQLRDLLLAGASSGMYGPADGSYFSELLRELS